MNAPSKTPILLTLTLLPLALSSAVAGDQVQQSTTPQASDSQASATRSPYSPLVAKVRNATWRFKDINAAISDGWVPATPCVSGPNEGAMGVHFVYPPRVRDGVLKGDEPEALIYQPMANGAMRLVGVEFIVVKEDWDLKHPAGPTPSVDGHLTHFVGEPNRYGLPAFYEIHVWAWEHNPNGNFADWNTLVNCDRQPGD
jgi:hypothetical protein